MSQNITTDALYAQCTELRKQLTAMTEERDRWHKQALELQRQAKAWEKLQLQAVAELRRETADHIQRISTIERQVTALKKQCMRREFLPCRRASRPK